MRITANQLHAIASQAKAYTLAVLDLALAEEKVERAERHPHDLKVALKNAEKARRNVVKWADAAANDAKWVLEEASNADR